MVYNAANVYVRLIVLIPERAINIYGEQNKLLLLTGII